ncbi:rhamnogalacturonan acetylesterase [Desarmillaria tabescens]|uniref:Rhamnogalacturonan acetylesterase n=1 Tax=Armillaria tabescens TaxID=1929756 RepID=A0AA39NH70_ARMTA|nr:rhamnogalacturonan acetylesterase [Desarmillaria tabescens]KAK0465577.1 rhamnogalacturonan acetylesterase [Desarmillaria tabescens]
MRLLSVVSLLCATGSALAQTIYLAGDSTMAKNGGGSGTGTDGWGQYLSQFVTLSVVNKAVGGQSARTYSEQGLFDSLVDEVESGDYVIIEFGHNDGSAGSVDNGKQDAVGDGYNITATVTTSNGTQILIHSFAYYIENAVDAIQAKGGIPIISSVTPDNIWDGDSIAAGGRFVTYAQSIGTRKGITYVDHYDYVAQAYNALGETEVTTYYPNDHLHTSPEGALVVAEAFVRGLLCGDSSLTDSVNSAGENVPNGCL